MGIAKQGRKVVRISGHRPFGGDPLVDTRTGIGTENHHELWRRLVAAGPTMHGPQGPRKPRKSS